MGTKVDDCLTAALCVSCHSQIDQGKDMSRDEKRQAMDRAILDTLVLLARQGYLVL
jgi:ferredoxin